MTSTTKPNREVLSQAISQSLQNYGDSLQTAVDNLEFLEVHGSPSGSHTMGKYKTIHTPAPSVTIDAFGSSKNATGQRERLERVERIKLQLGIVKRLALLTQGHSFADSVISNAAGKDVNPGPIQLTDVWAMFSPETDDHRVKTSLYVCSKVPSRTLSWPHELPEVSLWDLHQNVYLLVTSGIRSR
jgi:hypothetical protein